MRNWLIGILDKGNKVSEPHKALQVYEALITFHRVEPGDLWRDLIGELGNKNKIYLVGSWSFCWQG